MKAGALEFCWVNPGDVLRLGPEQWSPSQHGAFLYLRAAGLEPIYVPLLP